MNLFYFTKCFPPRAQERGLPSFLLSRLPGRVVGTAQTGRAAPLGCGAEVGAARMQRSRPGSLGLRPLKGCCIGASPRHCPLGGRCRCTELRTMSFFVLSENKSLPRALERHSEGKERLEPWDLRLVTILWLNLLKLPERGRVGLGGWAGLCVWGPDFRPPIG